MGINCAINPRIINSNGKEVDSALFKQALLLTKNRETSKQLFTISRMPEIRNNKGFTRDSNGEVLINELLEHPIAKSIVTESNVETLLEAQNKFIDKNGSKVIFKSREEAIELVNKFNKFHPFKDNYTALPSKDSNIQGITDHTISIVRNSRKTLEAKKAMDKTQELRNKILDIFNQLGIQPKFLTALEERLGINGIYNLPGMENIAKGFKNIVLVSKNDPNAESLSEEFSHTILEAMQEHPLVKRLYDNIKHQGLQSQILGEKYDRYKEMYQRDDDKIIKESMAHLLTNSLLDVNKVGNTGIHKGFLSRVFEAIKQFFSRVNPNDIDNALQAPKKITDDLAKGLLHGDLAKQVQLDLSKSDTFYSLNETVNTKSDILTKILQLEKKRLYILNNISSEEQTKEQRKYVENLQKRIFKGERQQVVYDFLKDSQEKLKSYEAVYISLLNTEQIKEQEENEGTPLNNKFKKLREIRNYVESYRAITENIQAEVRDDLLTKQNIYDSSTEELLEKNLSLLAKLSTYYNKVAMPYIIEFLNPYAQELRDLGIKEDQIAESLEDMLTNSDKDVTLAERYLDSLAESADPLLRLIDNVVKKQNEKSRYEQLELLHKMQELHAELEKAGHTNTEWMYQKDGEGKPTGYFISPYRFDLYYKDLHKFEISLNEKYGADPSDPVKQEQRNKSLKQWKEKRRIANMNLDTGKRSYSLKREGKYASDGWKRDSKGRLIYEGFDEAQQKYYSEYMKIRRKLLEATNSFGYMNDKLYLAPQIRKELFQRLRGSDNLKEAAKGLKKNLQDQFQYRYDDVDRQSRRIVEDFEGNPVRVLPKYYLRPLEDMSELALDATQGMLSFAHNSINYKHMNRVVDALEVIKDVSKDREVKVRRGNTMLEEAISTLGFSYIKPVIKKGEDTNFFKRLIDYMDMQLYGQYQSDEGEIHGLDIAKTANMINKLTAINSLGINFLAGLANIGISSFVTNTEAFTKEFFKKKDLATADKIYGENLMGVLGDIGSRFPKSKLSLFNQYFDTISNHDNALRNLKTDVKGYKRLLNSSTLFFMTNCGEHWIQSRLALALANTTEVNVKDAKGNITKQNLWEATEAVPIDPSNPDAGNKLQFKGILVDENGNELTKEEINEMSSIFSRKHKGISQKLNGIYNNLDKSAAQKYAVGRMVFLFRRWIRPMMNKRFRKAKYNYDVGSVEEGYFYTAWNTLKNFAIEWRAVGPKMAWDLAYGKLEDYQKKNIARALWESAFFTMLWGAIQLMDFADGDDDYKDNYAFNVVNYLTRRLYTEVGALRPGTQMLGEQFKLLQSPMAGVNTMDKLLNTLNAINPLSWTEEIKSGRYRGYPVAVRHLLNSPLVPMYRTIERAVYPREAVTFYK